MGFVLENLVFLFPTPWKKEKMGVFLLTFLIFLLFVAPDRMYLIRDTFGELTELSSVRLLRLLNHLFQYFLSSGYSSVSTDQLGTSLLLGLRKK